jgi:hypothetical protein
MWKIWETQRSLSSLQPPNHKHISTSFNSPPSTVTQCSASLHFTVNNTTWVRRYTSSSNISSKNWLNHSRPHPKTSQYPISSPVAVNTQASRCNMCLFLFRHNGLLSLFKLDSVHCLNKVQHSKKPALGLSTVKRRREKSCLFDITRQAPSAGASPIVGYQGTSIGTK